VSAVRPDLLGVVEAAYDLRGSEQGWVARVAERIAPFFDDGLGMMAGTFSLSPAGRFRLQPMVSTVAPEVVALTRRVHATAAVPDLMRAYSRRVGLNWVSETIDVQGSSASSTAVRALLGSVGAQDFHAVICADPNGHGMLVSLARRRRDRPAPATVAAWARVAVHLAAGLRLVRRLGDEEAVVHPGGRIAHAQGPARQADAREALRRAAVAIDRSRGPLRHRDRNQALTIWRGLVQGRWSLVDRFDQDGRRFLVAHRNDPRVRDPRALTPRERQVLGYAALGQSNKLVAYTLGITESAVASHLSAAMAKLGMRSRVDLVAWLGRLAAADRSIAPWRK